MKFKMPSRFFAAGSIGAVVLAIALTPFNMGGCSGGSAVNVGGLGNIPGGHGNAINNIDVNAAGQGLTKMVKSQMLDENAEAALGQSIALKATNTYKLYPDPDLTRYVTLVARTVGAASPASEYRIYIGVLDTDEINAFSGPRGYIFITRGAIRRMHDESELAGVVAHEIGHIAKQHGLKAVKNANFWAGAVETGAATEQHLAAFKGAADTAVNLVIVNGYSRDQEDEADAEAVKYTHNAGYDPNGFIRLLERIKAEQGGTKLFPTHPGIEARIKLMTAAIEKAGTGGTGVTLADRFHASVSLK